MQRGSKSFAVVMGVGVFSIQAALGQPCQTNADCGLDSAGCPLPGSATPCRGGSCAFGQCVFSAAPSCCDDGVFCNGGDVCNTQTFACSGPPPTCPGGQFCSLVFDRCVECDTNNQCNDFVFCNGIETCVDGGCTDGPPPQCPGDECSPGFCNSQTDVCDQDPPCFDNNLCTDDNCVVGVGCSNPSNNPAGTCCNPATGQFVTISDSNDCTIDTCNSQTGQVTHTPAPCSDNNACTLNDTCGAGGTCAGTNVSTIACTKDSDCPAGICNSVDGHCKCTPCSTSGQCNDSITCTTDTCNTSAGFCVNTANDSSCSQTLFCNQEACNRDVGCQARDFCSPTAGNPCVVSADCNEATDLCGGCPAPTVSAGGSRYINIAPATSGGSTSVALRVRGDCRDSQTSCAAADRYVDFDNPVDPGDPQAGRLVATSVFRDRSTWGTVRVRGTELIPSKKYFVYTECDFGGGNRKFSAPVAATLWKWSDNDNNVLVNFVDISREVDGFRGFFSPSLTKEQTDLRGVAADCKPDRLVNFVDISASVDTFQGDPFPCNVPCP